MMLDTKKRICVVIEGQIDSKALYDELRRFGMSVTDLAKMCYVYGTIDLAEPATQYILEICSKYGALEVRMGDVAVQHFPLPVEK